MNSEFRNIGVVLTLLLKLCSAMSPGIAEFYEDANFKGLMWRGRTRPYFRDSLCITLSEGPKISSIITGSCIMTYSKDKCQDSEDHPSYSFPAGNYSSLAEIQHHSQNADNVIKSFRQCVLDECDGVIVLYQRKEKAAVKLAEYFNITSCVNLPSYAAKNVDALVNHGNCVALYDGVNCEGKSVTIRGGVSKESLNLKHISFAGTAMSIGPCPNDLGLQCNRSVIHTITLHAKGK